MLKGRMASPPVAAPALAGEDDGVEVNQLAGNLTTQVRAIKDVSAAVTQGDLTRQVTVEASGEVAELKDIVNQMIENLRVTTERNAQQDWLNSNLARISGLMQGQRDLNQVSRLIMSEVTPLVDAQHGAFFLSRRRNGDGERGRASCGSSPRTATRSARRSRTASRSARRSSARPRSRPSRS